MPAKPNNLLTNRLNFLVKNVFMSKVVTRTFLGAIMLNLFLFLANQNRIYLIILVICICLGVIYEVITVATPQNEKFPINKGLCVYFVSIIFWYKVALSLILLYMKYNAINFITNLRIIVFALYSFGLVLFVSSLEKSKLSKQLLILTIVHMVSYIGGLTCNVATKNISFSKFFFIFPCLLVIINDIGAYFIGKYFGKRPLIAISPNKTIEGFFGGFLFTLVGGLLCIYLKMAGILLPDEHDQKLSIPLNSNLWYLNFPIIYIHGLSFICAASFLAPFTGFIASAIKRVFKKKDFGSLIPGHGGITDRMDCQLIMVYFTCYYLKATSLSPHSTALSIYSFILRNLTRDEFMELKNMM